MSDDKLDFLDETDETLEAQEAETEQVEEEQAEAAEQTEENAEEAEVQEEVEATGEEEAAPPVAQEEKPQAIPVTALLDEREKRQLAERKAEDAGRRLAELEAKQRAEQQKAPDWDEDPQAAAQFQQQTIHQQMEQQRLNQSRFFAEREFGKEAVAEAFEYFNQNPQLSHQLMSEASPFHAAVEFHQKQKFLSEVGENPEAYKEQMREQIRQEIMAEMTTSQTPKPKAPPPSMSKAPSAGKGDTITPGNTFDGMFS
ncbi:hypothetical protein Q5Y75_05680 [Ruegeria sp. 2205SS24-7]|uniref:hypothetical protein n=1 Tax=Ruegeria discodermiae TaxID=3064389 RepID=UPI0027412F62|nr:hypothetical protein [Ruegeria sp. 2205SS24-7]MDP5216701.1 hypothetical protein [Ruegeria sp. 2205SS24-7]